ncbi:hypothetical protein D3C84_840060 [compost metagenome]
MLVYDHLEVRVCAKQTFIEQPVHIFYERGLDTEAAVFVNSGLINDGEIELEWQLG